MPTGSHKIDALKKPSVFISALFVSFVLIFGVACLAAYISYKKATQNTVHSNEMRANLLAKLILEHQRAAIGIIRSYGNRPLLRASVVKKDVEEAYNHLADLVKNNPEIETAFITDPGGTLWVNYPIFKEALNQNLSYRDWYKSVSKGWAPYVSGVYKMIIGEKDLAVSICSPIFDRKGTVIGILATAQTSGFFQKVVHQIGLDLDAKITLIDQEGHIIYSNRFLYKREVTAYPSFEFVKKALEGGKGNVEVRDFSDGDKVKYVSFSPIEGIGWSVIVEKGKKEVLRSELAYLILIGATSLLIFIVVVLFLVFFREKYKQLIALKTLNEELTITNERCRTEIDERKRTEDTLRETQKQLRFVSAQRLIAQEQERRKIATEIHDSIGSALSAIKFKVDSTMQQMEKGSAPSESLEGLLPTVQQAIEESRRIQMNLRPSILDDLGILPTIQWQCREYQNMYPHIRIEKRIDLPEDKIPDSLKTVIYRISQEALNNIAKHGKANLVIFSLQNVDGTIELAIQDNGQGFNVRETLSKESSKRGLGLSSMRERAELSGGSFAIESAEGKGTIIRASWPLGGKG